MAMSVRSQGPGPAPAAVATGGDDRLTAVLRVGLARQPDAPAPAPAELSKPNGNADDIGVSLFRSTKTADTTRNKAYIKEAKAELLKMKLEREQSKRADQKKKLDVKRAAVELADAKAKAKIEAEVARLTRESEALDEKAERMEEKDLKAKVVESVKKAKEEAKARKGGGGKHVYTTRLVKDS